MTGFSLVSDWLRGWCEISGPITDRRKAKPKPFPGTFDSYFKIALYGPKITFGLTYEMTNLPFVFSKYQTTLLHEIYTVCQYFDSLCSK